MKSLSITTQSATRLALLGVGIIVMVTGLLEAVPQMIFAVNLGLSLCLGSGGAGLSLPMFAELVTHCDGCLLTIAGAASIMMSRVGLKPIFTDAAHCPKGRFMG